MRFTIKATAGAFVKFLQETPVYDDERATPLEPDPALGAHPRLTNIGNHVTLLPFFRKPPDQTFGSLVHEHGDLQGHILAHWPAEGSTTEDGIEQTYYDEAVAIGFKWTQIDEKLLVTMECYLPVAQDYFARLLRAIGYCWPESRLGGLAGTHPKDLTPRDVTHVVVTQRDGGFNVYRTKGNVVYRTEDGPVETGEPASRVQAGEKASVRRRSAPMPNNLSKDDQTIWRMYADGSILQDIADAITLGRGTVSNHLTQLFKEGLAPRFDGHWKRQKS
ncbi:MAG: hypothetical protein HY675_12770 [Chloroflexi bacterium]|nr:hypothetical protein [Chloroflexota bacterium]